jgi:plasmid replication initiation protein
VRKHGGRQRAGWRFDFAHLHRKSGSLARFTDFACDLRRIVARQPLPGYTLDILRSRRGPELLTFRIESSVGQLLFGRSAGKSVFPVDKR